MVLDGGFGSLDRRLEEGIGVAWKLEHNGHLIMIAVDGGLVGYHLTVNEVLLGTGIRDRSQRIHNHFGI